MQTLLILLTLCWPPSPDLPRPTPAPVADAIIDVTPENPVAEIEVTAEVVPSKRTIVGYRKQCINGVCTMVPIYAEPAPIPDKVGPAPLPSETEIAFWQRTKKAPPKPPPHTHKETGNEVCPYCGGTCWMIRMAERAAAAKGTTTSEEFSKRWGSGRSVRSVQPVGPVRRLFRGRGLFRGGAGPSGSIVPGRI